MAALSDFFPVVTTDIAGCPTPILEAAVRKAAITFCEDTLLLVETLAAFSSVAGTAEYTLSPPADHEVFTVLAVRYGEALLQPVSRTSMLQYGTEPDYPEGFWFERPTTLRLWGPADAVYDLTVSVTLKPTFSATTVADILRTDWEDEIAHYAKYWLARQPGKAWSNPELAATSFELYHRGVARCRRAEETGHAHAPLSVAMRPFA